MRVLSALGFRVLQRLQSTLHRVCLDIFFMTFQASASLGDNATLRSSESRLSSLYVKDSDRKPIQKSQTHANIVAELELQSADQ